MLVLVSYDISDNKRRQRVAKLLEGFGVRVLESVFECDLTQAQWAKLEKKLRRRLVDGQDRFRIYFLCETCTAKTQIIGEGSVERSPLAYIV